VTTEQGRRRLRWLAIVAAFLVLVAGTGLVWSYRLSQTSIQIEVDGLSETVRTHRLTVGDLLEELDLSLLPADTLSPDSDTVLTNDLRVDIRRARRVDIETSGRFWTHLTQAKTVGEVLEENLLELDSRDRLWLEDQIATLDTPLPARENLLVPPKYARGYLWEQQHPLPARLRLQRAVPVTIDDGGLPFTLYTTAATVSEALIAGHVTIYLGDSVLPSLDSPVSADLTVYIERSTPIVVFADDETLKTRTRQETVGDALAEQGISLAGLDRVSPSLATPLLDNMVIRIARLREATEIEQELIPYDSAWIADDGLEIDHQRLDDPGQEGVTNSRFRLVSADGLEATRSLEYTWVAQEPITRTLAYGRMVVTRTLETPEGPLVYWRKIRMSATSYSASTAGVSPDNPYFGYTRLGDPMRHGIVAVDPAVIRLGTDVYVPGYGQGYVGDTGSAIKGKRIDLGYDDDNLVLWSQWVDVYLLAPVPPSYQIKWVLPNWPRE